MGEKSGSVVSHSLIFQSQAAAESVGGWGGGCVAFFLGGNTGRWEGFKKNVQTCNPRLYLGIFIYIFWLWWGNPQVFVEHKNPSFFSLRDIFPRKVTFEKIPSFSSRNKNSRHPTKGPNSDCFCKNFGGINSSTPSCGFEKISDIIRIPWFSKGIDHTQISGVDRSPWQKRQSRWLSWEESCMMTVGSRVGQDIILYLFARWNFVLLPTGTATLLVGDWWKLSEVTTFMRFPGRHIFRCPLDPP